MKVLVTGGCGFIGSNYIIQQIAAGNKVMNLDKLTYAGNIENLKSLETLVGIYQSASTKKTVSFPLKK